MFWLKSCPRCGGDLYQGQDVYGKYVSCLQCGGYLSAAQEAALAVSKAAATRTRPGSRPAVACAA